MPNLRQKIKKAEKTLDKLYKDIESLCINDTTRTKYIERAIINNEAKLRKYENENQKY